MASIVQPLTQLSEDELMMKESVAKLASQIIAPFVKKMDIQQSFEPDVVNALFSNGVIHSLVFIYISKYILNINYNFILKLMGLEIDPEYGGAGGSFMSAIITIEELAKIDPAVSVFCDIQNTLINTLFKKLGTQEQKDKYLPKLAQDTVTSYSNNIIAIFLKLMFNNLFRLVVSAFQKLSLDRMLFH